MQISVKPSRILGCRFRFYGAARTTEEQYLQLDCKHTHARSLEPLADKVAIDLMEGTYHKDVESSQRPARVFLLDFGFGVGCCKERRT